MASLVALIAVIPLWPREHLAWQVDTVVLRDGNTTAGFFLMVAFVTTAKTPKA